VKWILFPILVLFAGCSPFSEGPGRSIASSDELDIKAVQNLLKPFVSQGCPRFPNGIEYPNQDKWALCCVQHDVSYWKGGTAEDRAEADKQLRACIIEQNEPNTAGLVYLGVRHADTETHGTTHRWGYGWVINRGYTPLTETDKAQVAKLEKDIPSDYSRVRFPSSLPAGFPKFESLTKNYCVDAVLSFIQHQLHRTLTPMRVDHHIESLSAGFVETIKINDQLYAEPYEFKFEVPKRGSCNQPPNQWPADHPVRLKSFSY
jgi:hypothetical protein